MMQQHDIIGMLRQNMQEAGKLITALHETEYTQVMNDIKNVELRIKKSFIHSLMIVLQIPLIIRFDVMDALNTFIHPNYKELDQYLDNLLLDELFSGHEEKREDYFNYNC